MGRGQGEAAQQPQLILLVHSTCTSKWGPTKPSFPLLNGTRPAVGEEAALAAATWWCRWR